MKKYKNLLLCILISVLATTLIYMTQYIIDRIIEYDVINWAKCIIDSDYSLNYTSDKYEEYLDNSELIHDREAIEELLLLNIENKLDEFKNTEPGPQILFNEYGIDDEAFEEYVNSKRDNQISLSYSELAVEQAIAGIIIDFIFNYLISIILGIASGILIYYIFIKNSKFKDIIIPSIISLILIIIAFELDSIFTYRFYPDVTNISLVICFLLIIGILFFINIIYRKRLLIKLNKTLKNYKK